MKKENLIDQLRKYLHPVTIAEIEIQTAIPRSIGICSTIHRIVEEYNSSQANEDRVCELLSDICRIHFSKRRSVA